MTAWLVESYWPATAGSPAPVVERIREATAHALAVRLVGVMLVPVDEMALWRFDARTAEELRSVLANARVAFERVVDVVELFPVDA